MVGDDTKQAKKEPADPTAKLTTVRMVGRSKSGSRRKHWFRHWRVKHHFKRAGSSIRGGLSSVFRRGGRSGNSDEVDDVPHRNITVHYLKMGQTRDTYLSMFEEWTGSADFSEKNLSSSLLLTQLQDGKFTSMIALDHLPVADVRILVCGYKLEIFLDSRLSEVNTKRKMCRPQKLGDIDIPIYVNTATLTFTIDEQEDALSIVGMTKGFFAREKLLNKGPPSRSSSFTNLVQGLKGTMPSPLMRSKKKREKTRSTFYDQEDSDSEKSDTSEQDEKCEDDLFRGEPRPRAYTQ